MGLCQVVWNLSTPWMTIKKLGIRKVVVVFYAATFATGPRYRRCLVKIRKPLYGVP